MYNYLNYNDTEIMNLKFEFRVVKGVWLILIAQNNKIEIKFKDQIFQIALLGKNETIHIIDLPVT